MHLPFGGENRDLGRNPLPGGFVSPSGLGLEKVFCLIWVSSWVFLCSGKSCQSFVVDFVVDFMVDFVVDFVVL